MIAKKTVVRITGAAAALLALGTMTFATPANAQTPPQPGMHMGGMRGGNERHPEIRRAIRALENAKDHLQRADHDFGGHRVDAINACDQAIAQLKVCLRYDRH